MQNDKILNFGKFKGMKFSSTPVWYQEWLLKQDWYNKPQQAKPLYKQLNGWDGHSRKGQAIYDQIFEEEMRMSRAEDCRLGICTCCEGSMYYGMNN